MTKEFELTWKGKEALAEIVGALPDALFAAGEQIVDVASSKIRHNVTGDLRRSGYVTMKGRSTYRKAKNHHREAKTKPGQVAAAFAAFYAGFVEFGHPLVRNKIRIGFVPAKPYFRPAVDELKARLGLTIAMKMKAKLK